MSTGGTTIVHPYRECPVCLNAYGEVHVPKLLPCHHTFCLPCIQHLGQQFTCPSCRSPIKVPPPGPQALQTNFYITDIQAVEPQDVHAAGGTDKQVLAEGGCVKHHFQPLCFFCRWCSEVICRDCTVLDHCQTEGHDVVDVHETFEDEKHALITMTRSANQTIQSRQAIVQRLQREKTNMAATKDEAMKSIDKYFEEFSEILNQRKKFLKDAIDAIYKQKSEQLQDKMEDLITNITCLVSATEVCSDLILATSLTELLTVKESILPEMSSLLNQDYDKLTIGSYMQFNNHSGVRSFKMASDNLGKVEVGKTLPSSIIITDSTNLIPGFIATLSIQAVDVKNRILPSYPITASITDPYNDSILTKTSESGNGYQLSFTPQVSGDHTVKFYFMGLELESHVIVVQCNEPVLIFGERGSRPGQFEYPFSITVDRDGNIFVGDSGNCRVQKFDPSGKFLEEIRIESAVEGGEDEEEYPLSVFDVAINPQNHLVISLGDSIGDEESDASDNDDTLSVTSSESDESEPCDEDECKDSDSDHDLVYDLPSPRSYSRGSARHQVAALPKSGAGTSGYRSLPTHRSAFLHSAATSTNSDTDTDLDTFYTLPSRSKTGHPSTAGHSDRVRAAIRNSTSLPAIGGAASDSHLTRSPSTDRYGSLGRRRNRFRSHSSVSVHYDLDIKTGPRDTKLIEETVYFAVNSKNQYVTSAFQEETVNVYNRYGQYLFNVVDSANVSSPQKVCIGQNEEIVVADAGNHRVKVFTESGSLVREFGHKGNSKGKLHEIHGIAVDSQGRIVVGDEANKRVQVFSREGQLLSVIESNNDPMKCPTGLCLTPDGHVLIVDTTGHKIYKFKYC